VNPALKYFLGRVGLFVVVAVPVLLLLPRSMNVLLKLMIALLASAVVSYFVLRPWRAEVAERMSANARRRREEQDRLRSALAGDDEPGSDPRSQNGGEANEPNNEGHSEEDPERP